MVELNLGTSHHSQGYREFTSSNHINRFCRAEIGVHDNQECEYSTMDRIASASVSDALRKSLWNKISTMEGALAGVEKATKATGGLGMQPEMDL